MERARAVASLAPTLDAVEKETFAREARRLESEGCSRGEAEALALNLALDGRAEALLDRLVAGLSDPLDVRRYMEMEREAFEALGRLYAVAVVIARDRFAAWWRARIALADPKADPGRADPKSGSASLRAPSRAEGHRAPERPGLAPGPAGVQVAAVGPMISRGEGATR